MARVLIAIVCLALAGCAGETKRETPAPPVVERSPIEPKPEQAAAIEPVPEATTAAVPPAEVPPAPPVKTAPPAKTAAKVAAPVVPVPVVPVPVAAPAVEAEPQLDMAGLTARLRETSAIGVFTKLALKNQVDDLLKQFRAHYQGGVKTGVAALRQPYDMLVMKVLALIQDGDPSLARMISASREAIWAILSDREKFNAAS